MPENLLSQPEKPRCILSRAERDMTVGRADWKERPVMIAKHILSNLLLVLSIFRHVLCTVRVLIVCKTGVIGNTVRFA